MTLIVYDLSRFEIYGQIVRLNPKGDKKRTKENQNRSNGYVNLPQQCIKKNRKDLQTISLLKVLYRADGTKGKYILLQYMSKIYFHLRYFTVPLTLKS